MRVPRSRQILFFVTYDLQYNSGFIKYMVETVLVKEYKKLLLVKLLGNIGCSSFHLAELLEVD